MWMLLPERIKNIKATPPAQTISRIQHIVSRLGCHTELTDDSTPPFFSCRLALFRGDEKLPIFSTSGKGMDAELAAASALAELMERLQNLAFYMSTIYFSEPENCSPADESPTTFKYSADEQSLRAEELVERDFILLRGLLAQQKITKSGLKEYLTNGLHWQTMRCVPFINHVTDNKAWVPFRFLQWIVGSNGMCAGNSREEALVQGLSEICERYVLKRFYTHPFTPPEIPLDYFVGVPIYERIRQLQKDAKLKISIKDCSMTIGLPVVGVLLVSPDNRNYCFHLGADPCPITALERCFTELYQGRRRAFYPIVGLPEDEQPLDHSSWRQQLHRTISSCSGKWPVRILAANADYEFRRFSHPVSTSDHEDFQWLLQKMDELGYSLLIRESGFLGFPAFHVFVPGMSEMTNVLHNRFVEQLSHFERLLPLFYKMKNASPTQRQNVADGIEAYAAASLNNEFDSRSFFRHCPHAPAAAMSGAEIVAALRTGLLPESQPDCFDCNDCTEIDCRFASMSSVWETIKQYQRDVYPGRHLDEDANR
jgi:ribosomal protein S12 methylthiotransferase accessory factor